MPSRPLAKLFTALTIAACAALFAAVALVPAPPAVLPLAALICIGGPVVSTSQLRQAARRTDDELLADLRRRLDALPEVEHPLGR
jgi:peptidoglycan/LPS O-acetylase OafA/YrhL